MSTRWRVIMVLLFPPALLIVLACGPQVVRVGNSDGSSSTSTPGTSLLRSTPGQGGPGTIADIAVLFKAGTSSAEMQAVGSLLQVPRPDGRGVDMEPGVLALSYDYEHPALFVNLHPDVTDLQRQTVIGELKEAPNVTELKLGIVVGS